MSSTEPTRSDEVFCDTCVLLDYVLDQGNEGARELLIEADDPKVISEKVESEFNKVPDRREDIYLDFMKIITSDDTTVEETEIGEREYLSPNDMGFFEQLKEEVVEGDSPTERLKILREKQKLIDRRFGQTQEIISRICEQNDDFGLLLNISKIVSNEDDCQVISDAVKWAMNGGSGKLTTLDSKDIIQNSDAINDAISDYHEEPPELHIMRPTDSL